MLLVATTGGDSYWFIQWLMVSFIFCCALRLGVISDFFSLERFTISKDEWTTKLEYNAINKYIFKMITMQFTIMSVLRTCLYYSTSFLLLAPWWKTSVHSLSAIPSSNATLFFFEWFFLVSTITFYMNVRWYHADTKWTKWIDRNSGANHLPVYRWRVSLHCWRANFTSESAVHEFLSCTFKSVILRS